MHTGLEGHSIPKFLLPFLKAEEDHRDLRALGEYFAERARGGAGLMVTGGIAPNREGWLGPFASKLTTRDEVALHREVTDMVRAVEVPTYSPDGAEGGASERARLVMQILHAGRYAAHPFAVSCSSTKSPISPFKAKELSLGGVKSTISDFVSCAALAKEAGYDGVEIMGSEGYLINQFLVGRTNKRGDEYGGGFANRMKFATEIVSQTREAVGEDFIIIFRLSMMDLIDDGSTWDEVVTLAQAIESAGATIINTGIGWHEARVPTIATSVPRGTFSFVTSKLRASGAVGIPLCATNRINAPHVAERVLSSGEADLISMARPFLADPYILSKSREGRADEINTCIACNQACLDHAFVGKTASCLVNPRACHETELAIEEDSVPADRRLRIGVVGSGPAGMAFATTAAAVGHDVVLYDRAEEIGGQFNMAKRIPGKEEFHETIRYFTHKMDALVKKGKLTIKLGTEVSYEDMERLSSDPVDSDGHCLRGRGPAIDRWIVATGVDPRLPPIPGVDHPNVLSYIDVLRRKKPVGKRVAIVGAGGIGFDVAEYLLKHDDDADHDPNADETDLGEFLDEWGVDPANESRGGLKPTRPHGAKREIVLMQRKKGKLGAGLGRTTGWIHRATLVNSGSVEMLDRVKYEEIDEEGRLHISVPAEGKGKGKGKEEGERERRVLDVDNVIICAGQISQRDLERQARDHESNPSSPNLADRVYTIGGAYEALELDAKRAIDMGTRLALKVHDEGVVPGKHVFRAKVGAEEKLYGVMRKFMGKK